MNSNISATLREEDREIGSFLQRGQAGPALSFVEGLRIPPHGRNKWGDGFTLNRFTVNGLARGAPLNTFYLETGTPVEQESQPCNSRLHPVQ